MTKDTMRSEAIMKFFRSLFEKKSDPLDKGVMIDGYWMEKDGRKVFQTNGGQQLLVNEDGSMVALGLNAGMKVTLIQGDPTTLATIDTNIEALGRVFHEEHPELKSVRPGFIGLQTSELLRFDPASGSTPMLIKVELLDHLPPVAQQAIREGMFVFGFHVVTEDGSEPFLTPEYPPSS